jgi:hypothetical protein
MTTPLMTFASFAERRMRTPVAILALLCLAACSPGDSSKPAPDADDLAAEIGCKGDSADEADKVSCETKDAFVGITVYQDNRARDADVKAARSVGAAVLVGDRFMIDASDPAELERVQDIVGGDLK